MAMHHGLKMNISAVKVVVLVHMEVTVAVHRHRIHRVVVHMLVVARMVLAAVAAMAMLMHQILEHCHQHRPVFSIQHQVRRYTDSIFHSIEFIRIHCCLCVFCM